MARCFVTRELPGRALDRLAAEHEVDVWPERTPPPPEVLRERVAEVEGLLCLLTDRVDDALLDAAPRLRVISNLAVGADNVDVAAAARRSIAVGYTPGVLTETTADLALALMLAIARRLPEGVRAVRGGEWLTWEPGWLLGRDVHGATLAVIGPGRIGEAVARRAEAGFGMTVLRVGRGDDPRPALERADFVSLHVPLSDETRGMVDADFLAAMRPSAYLVNTARGGIVDQDALAEALHGAAIAGAALDVTDPEPLPPNHPLLRAPNLLVLPHLGSATHATRERMADLAVGNLLAGLAGEPLPHAFPGSIPARWPRPRSA